MSALSSHFTDDYRHYTQLYFSQVQDDEPPLRIPEKTIRCIWNDQLFKTRNLQTLKGDELQVVFPGFWNFGAGPDFKNATIRINGKILEGDVELHVFATDWEAHKHGGNPEYENVILHVFMWQGRGAESRSLRPLQQQSPASSKRPVHELEIKSYLTKGILELNDQLDFDTYPLFNELNVGLCHPPLKAMPREKLAYLLSSAGDARIYTKMERFHNRIINTGYEQTFYEGLSEALGYPNNKKSFSQLAESVPLETLHKVVPDGLTGDEKALHYQAILFGVSGLLDAKFKNPNVIKTDPSYFRQINQLWNEYRVPVSASPMDPGQWSFSGIRPANYPYRRLAGLAHLLVCHEQEGLFAGFIASLKKAISSNGNIGYTLSTKDARRLHEFFCVESTDYWAHHYTVGGKTLSRSQQLIGPDRSSAITVNILIPIGLIYARASKSIAMEAGMSQLFSSGKRPPDNKSTRFMKHYILGNQEDMLKLVGNTKESQGLMQIYQDYCTQNGNNCHRCHFPDVVKKYFM